MRLLGYRAAVAVLFDRAVIAPPPCRVGQVFDVVADRDNDLVGDVALVYQVERKQVGHFAQHEPRLIRLVGALEHLT